MGILSPFPHLIGCAILPAKDWFESGELEMLIQPYSRFFLRHELRFRTPYNHGEPLPFRTEDDLVDVATALQTAVDKKKASLTLQNKDVVRLTKMNVRPKDHLAILLFRRSDPDAATPVFEHEKTQNLRKSDKAKDEGLAISSHLFVNLKGIPDAAHPTYPAILEEVPGLSRTYIQLLLSDVLKEMPYKYTDRKGEKKDTHTMVDLNGVKSEKFEGGAKGNTVPYITLVRPGNVKGLDTGGLVVPREERLKLVIRAKPEDTLDIIDKIKKWMKKNDWSKYVLQVNTAENRTRLVSLAREADAADILFVRAVPVDVKIEIPVCTEVINEELVTKAQELFACDEKKKKKA